MRTAFARELRLRRLYHHSDRLFVVPLDHPVTDGTVVGGGCLDHLVGQLARQRVDAVVLHKGCLRRIGPDRFRDLSVIVHLSAGTTRAPDPDQRYLVGGVDEALSLGADAVSVHVNVGSATEPRQIADLAAVAGACERWGVPLLAMMYPRGPAVSDPRDPGVITHAVAIAADLGADLVKTIHPGSVAAMRRVTATAPVPVLVAGGAPHPQRDGVLGDVRAALAGGAGGVAIGRNVIQSDDPSATARALADLIHERDHERNHQRDHERELT